MTACGTNEESQKHIIEFRELLKCNQELREKVNSRPKGHALVSICVSPFFPMLLRKRTSR